MIRNTEGRRDEAPLSADAGAQQAPEAGRFMSELQHFREILAQPGLSEILLDPKNDEIRHGMALTTHRLIQLLEGDSFEGIKALCGPDGDVLCHFISSVELKKLRLAADPKRLEKIKEREEQAKQAALSANPSDRQS